MNLNYIRSDDYFIPDLELTKEILPIGKGGRRTGSIAPIPDSPQGIGQHNGVPMTVNAAQFLRKAVGNGYRP